MFTGLRFFHFLRYSTMAIVLAIPFGGTGGCGGGGDREALSQEEVAAAGAVVGVVMNAASGLSDQATLVIDATKNADSCITTEYSDGSFSTTCTAEDCQVNGVVQGTETRTFTGSRPLTSCTVDGVEKTGRDLVGNETRVFNNCIKEDCGTVMNLTGSLTIEVESTRDACTGAALFSTTDKTADACSGLTVTFKDHPSLEVGLEITYQLSIGANALSTHSANGSICVKGKPIGFESLNDLPEKTDPEGLCTEEKGVLACTDCINDCLGYDETSTEETCRSGVCAYLCGEYDCSAEDDNKCKDAIESFAPVDRMTPYRDATKCTKLGGPCEIDCSVADPDDLSRCADLAAQQMESFGLFPQCLGADSCSFTYECAGFSSVAECPGENSCSTMNSEIFFCDNANACESDADCANIEGALCLPVDYGAFSTCTFSTSCASDLDCFSPKYCLDRGVCGLYACDPDDPNPDALCEASVGTGSICDLQNEHCVGP